MLVDIREINCVKFWGLFSCFQQFLKPAKWPPDTKLAVVVIDQNLFQMVELMNDFKSNHFHRLRKVVKSLFQGLVV